uniref:Uncharacterized protein n=1 Tax=Oryza barthii TaxID=65489 RepID=A0A0D3GMN3_9ORYZ
MATNTQSAMNTPVARGSRHDTSACSLSACVATSPTIACSRAPTILARSYLARTTSGGLELGIASNSSSSSSLSAASAMDARTHGSIGSHLGWSGISGRWLRRRRRRRSDGLVEVVDPETDLAANPVEEALLLEGEVDERLLTLADELARVEADAAEEVAPAAGADADVVEDGHLERLAADVAGAGAGDAGEVELERLVPRRVELARHGVRLAALAVEVNAGVRARRARAVLGEQVPRLHHLHHQLPHRLGRRHCRTPLLILQLRPAVQRYYHVAGELRLHGWTLSLAVSLACVCVRDFKVFIYLLINRA